MPPEASSATSSKRSRRLASPSTATNLLRARSSGRIMTPAGDKWQLPATAHANLPETDDRLDTRRTARRLRRLRRAPLREEEPDDRRRHAEAAAHADQNVRSELRTAAF